jgi:hypothetical protein
MTTYMYKFSSAHSRSSVPLVFVMFWCNQLGHREIPVGTEWRNQSGHPFYKLIKFLARAFSISLDVIFPPKRHVVSDKQWCRVSVADACDSITSSWFKVQSVVHCISSEKWREVRLCSNASVKHHSPTGNYRQREVFIESRHPRT